MASGSHCPKCNGRMEEGFTADHGHGAYHVAAWLRGKPDRRWWGLKVQKKQLLTIQTFRCTRCGYLENYAK